MISLATIYLIGKIIGTVTTVSGLIIGAFKMFSWVKTKFVNIDANVTALKSTMEVGFQNLSQDIKNQTTTIASELKEQRADFRTFYAPTLLMMQQATASIQPAAAPIRAKRSAKKIRKKA